MSQSLAAILDHEWMTPLMDKNELKRLMKEALKEWLDEKFADFGRWSFMSIAAAALVALTYFIFWVNDWKK